MNANKAMLEEKQLFFLNKISKSVTTTCNDVAKSLGTTLDELYLA
jgi:hypothetical protein